VCGENAREQRKQGALGNRSMLRNVLGNTIGAKSVLLDGLQRLDDSRLLDKMRR